MEAQSRVNHTLIGVLCATALLLFGCAQSNEDTPNAESLRAQATEVGNRYAVGFALDSVPGWRILTVGNLWRGSTSAFRYVIRKEDFRQHPLPDSLRGLPRITPPLQRIVLLSTTHLALVEALGLTSRVVGLDDQRWVYSPQARQILDSLGVPSVGVGPSLDLEVLFQLAPDAIFSFATGSGQFDTHPRLTAARLPLILTSDWMETHPLGRLEWIRVFGVLLGEEKRADSIFSTEAQAYEELTQRMSTVAQRPDVLMGVPSGDAWYLPGGQSYMARLVDDAGGNYLWREDPDPGTLVLSVESVLQRVVPGQLWLNPGIWNSRTEARQLDSRVEMIPAFQSGAVFYHGHRRNPQGGSDFFEGAVVRPAALLRDLVYLFHGDSLPAHQSQWYAPLP